MTPKLSQLTSKDKSKLAAENANSELNNECQNHVEQLLLANARVAVMMGALEPALNIAAQEPTSATDSDNFERGCPLTKKQIRAMQAVLQQPNLAAQEMIRKSNALDGLIHGVKAFRDFGSAKGGTHYDVMIKALNTAIQNQTKE